MVGVVLLHRNYRLNDNKALQQALQQQAKVIMVFIGTPEQLNSKEHHQPNDSPVANSYFSNNSVQFMVQSLEDLNTELQKYNSKVHIFYGNYKDIISLMLSELDKQFPNSKHGIYMAHDFTPYAKQREANIKQICTDNNVDLVITQDDLTIVDINTIKTQKGDFYKTFKYFYVQVKNKVKDITIEDYSKDYNKLTTIEFCAQLPCYTFAEFHQTYNDNPKVIVKGGRTNGLTILQKIPQFELYGENRDEPMYNTTLLSAYIKFGCLSMREVALWAYKNYGAESELLRQVIWHDFFANLMENISAERSIGGGNYQEKKVKWQYDEKLWQAWQNGQTGFPMCDAGMRQLNSVGWMHNRARMVVVGVLCHMFLLDWHLGEKYFAQHLVDYDVSSNNGNWQATAGVGYDYRWYVFNPFLQSKKYDKECFYIKKWLPELKDVPNKDIHEWQTAHTKYSQLNYPGPLVDYSVQRDKAKQVI